MMAAVGTAGGTLGGPAGSESHLTPPNCANSQLMLPSALYYGLPLSMHYPGDLVSLVHGQGQHQGVESLPAYRRAKQKRSEHQPRPAAGEPLPDAMEGKR